MFHCFSIAISPTRSSGPRLEITHNALFRILRTAKKNVGYKKCQKRFFQEFSQEELVQLETAARVSKPSAYRPLSSYASLFTFCFFPSLFPQRAQPACRAGRRRARHVVLERPLPVPALRGCLGAARAVRGRHEILFCSQPHESGTSGAFAVI